MRSLLLGVALPVVALGLGCGGSRSGGGAGSGDSDAAAGGGDSGGAGNDAASAVDGSGSPGPDGAAAGDSGTIDGGGDGASCVGVNLQTDANNCGACGRSCQGGTCTAGACSAVTLATLQEEPFSLAVDATSIYWTNVAGGGQPPKGGSVMKSALDGTGATKLLGQAATDYTDLALDATRVFVTAYGAADGFVLSLPKSGIVASTLYMAANGVYSPGTIVSNLPTGAATELYLVNYQTAVVFELGADGGAPITIGGPTHTSGGFFDPESVAYDTTNVFVSDLGTEANGAYTGGAIWRVPIPTGTKVGVGAAEAISLAVDGTNVYATDVSGKVIALPKAGSDAIATILATGVGATGLVVDSTAVYWTERGGAFVPGTGWSACAGAGALHKTVLASHSDVKLVTGLNCPSAIAQDATTVYFAELGTDPAHSSDGTIKKVAK
jgi:hypothetical protein